MTLKAIGLLSPGDMGHMVGNMLLTHGMPVLTCLQDRSERTRNLARKVGIEDVPTYQDLVRDTDLIMSILVPAEAENAAKNVARALHSTGETTIYVDCNAIAPETALRIEKIINEADSQFLDASILGPPPRRMGTTRFYVSGSDIKDFKTLADFGLDVRPLGQEIGLAKGIKMTYAALTKGFAAISTELLIAARRMGLYEALIEELRTNQTNLYNRMERVIPNIPERSRRWIGEMQEIAKTFKSLGLTPKIYQGAAEVYTLVGGSQLADVTPETKNRLKTLQEVIKTLSDRLEGCA